ncbi:MAG: hypothetical protein IKW19_00270 [Akkermansia sp.]|nr:hypothetical protein [Akkermansia sp.]
MKAWYLTREQQADGSHVWVKSDTPPTEWDDSEEATLSELAKGAGELAYRQSLEVDYKKAAEHEQILIRQMLGEK